MKLSKAAVGRIATVAGLSWAVFTGLRCAQGEDLSSAPKDSGPRPGTGGGSGTGGSNAFGTGGSGGSNGAGTGGVFIGVGGSSNSGGATGTGGGGVGGSGFVGAGGSSGAAGTGFIGVGGTTVTDSGGGTGGSAGGGSDFDGPVSMGLQVVYKSTMASQVQFDIEVTNTGVDLPVINTLKLRYYFSEDSFASGTSVIFDTAAWNGPAMPYYTDFHTMCSATLNMLQTTNLSATSYYEFGCNSMATIGPADRFSLTFRSPTQGENVTDDYSYVAADGSAKVLDPHLVIYQGATVVWGVPPP